MTHPTILIGLKSSSNWWFGQEFLSRTAFKPTGYDSQR